MTFALKKKSSFSDETEKEHYHGNHCTRAMGFLADDVNYFHLLIILVKYKKCDFMRFMGILAEV